MSVGLEAGFADPVHDAQTCFRAVLDAMSHPGRIARIAGAAVCAPFDPAACAVLLTLVDHETPLWLDPDAERARKWIEFHCGAPIVAAPDDRRHPPLADRRGCGGDALTACDPALSLPPRTDS